MLFRSEDYHPYVKEATGYRNFFSLAADAKFSKDTKLETDFEYQRKSQFSVPGYQLLGDNTLPPIDPFRHLTANQTWAKPVASNQINFGARLSTEINSNWKAQFGYQFSQIKTDDNLAFPWGDATLLGGWSASQGYPINSNHFSNNGTFVIYDFRSLNELRNNQEITSELDRKSTRLNSSHT